MDNNTIWILFTEDDIEGRTRTMRGVCLAETKQEAEDFFYSEGRGYERTMFDGIRKAYPYETLDYLEEMIDLEYAAARHELFRTEDLLDDIEYAVIGLSRR